MENAFKYMEMNTNNKLYYSKGLIIYKLINIQLTHKKKCFWYLKICVFLDGIMLLFVNT